MSNQICTIELTKPAVILTIQFSGGTYVREQNNTEPTDWMDGERDSHALSSHRNIPEHDFENI